MTGRPRHIHHRRRRRSPGLALAAAVLFMTGAALLLPRGDLSAASGGAGGAGGRSGQEVDVIDARTLRIDGSTVRLAGIDAPALGQMCMKNERFVSCGEEAATALSRIVSLRLKPLVCSPADGDPGASLCTVDGSDVAESLVAQGHALARGDRYGVAARQAEKAGLGLRGMVFVPPEAWRSGTRLPGEAQAAREAERTQAGAREARSQAGPVAERP